CNAAVDYALAGTNAGMPVIVRPSEEPSRWTMAPPPRTKIANRAKEMPAGCLRRDRSGTTERARRSPARLTPGEAPPPYGRDGLPAYVSLKNVAVKSRLAPWADWAGWAPARSVAALAFHRHRRGECGDGGQLVGLGGGGGITQVDARAALGIECRRR